MKVPIIQIHHIDGARGRELLVMGIMRGRRGRWRDRDKKNLPFFYSGLDIAIAGNGKCRQYRIVVRVGSERTCVTIFNQSICRLTTSW
jgi:hypothetical protein